MTEKQASAWVEENCRFAMIEEAKDTVKTAALRAGIRLSDKEACFHAAKIIVSERIKATAAMTVQDALDQYGLNEEDLNKIIADAAAQGGWSVNNTVNNAISALEQAVSSKSRVQPGGARPTLNLRSQMSKEFIEQKVKGYFKQADPAQLYVERGQQQGLQVGPHAGEAQRATLSPPPDPKGQSAAPIARPTPDERPIPRVPASKPLPRPSRQPVVRPLPA